MDGTGPFFSNLGILQSGSASEVVNQGVDFKIMEESSRLEVRNHGRNEFDFVEKGIARPVGADLHQVRKWTNNVTREKSSTVDDVHGDITVVVPKDEAFRNHVTNEYEWGFKNTFDRGEDLIEVHQLVGVVEPGFDGLRNFWGAYRD